MRKAEQLWNRFTDSSDLSDEAMPGQTIVEIFGFNRVLIENHRGVNLYESERIVVRGKSGNIQICGEKLELDRMSRETLVIKGCIRQVTLQRGC